MPQNVLSLLLVLVWVSVLTLTRTYGLCHHLLFSPISDSEQRDLNLDSLVCHDFFIGDV
jgi:hypothetical protein